MIAPARRSDAAATSVAYPSTRVYELWSEAVSIRQEWLDHALSTQPADRPAAERAITGIYARIGRPRPHIEWVDSPAKALPLVGGFPTLDVLYRWIRGRSPQGTPPLASDLAALVSSLRSALSDGLAAPDPELSPRSKRKRTDPWPDLPPREALAFGVPFGVVLERTVQRTLFRSLADGLYLRVRATLAAAGGVPVCWYGQHEAAWVAYYDALQRLGLARYGADENRHFDEWAALARSCGWWWPGEDRCVVVERPVRVAMQTVPDAGYGELRLARDGITYRDGWRPEC